MKRCHATQPQLPFSSLNHPWTKSVKCLVSCSALVAQPAAGQLLTPLIRESSDATFENCPKSDTEQRRIRDPRRRQKRTLLRQKSSVFWKKGRLHSCPAVSYVYTERPCRVREPEVLADREGAGLMQDRMNAVRIRVFTLLFFEGRMPLNPCTFFPG